MPQFPGRVLLEKAGKMGQKQGIPLLFREVGNSRPEFWQVPLLFISDIQLHFYFIIRN